MAYFNAKSDVFGDPSFPMAVTVISVGNMVGVAAGVAATVSATAGLKIVGLAVKGDGNARGNLNSNGDIDNSAGTSGGINVVVQSSFPKSGGRRAFWMQNDTGTPCAAINIGQVCYGLNGTTVTMNTAYSKAGTILGFNAAANLVQVIFDQ